MQLYTNASDRDLCTNLTMDVSHPGEMADSFPIETRVQAHSRATFYSVQLSSLGDVPHELHVCDERTLPGLAQVWLDVDKLHRACKPAHLVVGMAKGVCCYSGNILRRSHVVSCTAVPRSCWVPGKSRQYLRRNVKRTNAFTRL